MRHKKKAIGLALIAALALSACGSKKESGGTTETTAAATETTAAATPTTSGKADDSNNVTAFVEETGGTSATSEGIVEGGTLHILDHSTGATNLDPQRIYTGADLGFLEIGRAHV